MNYIFALQALSDENGDLLAVSSSGGHIFGGGRSTIVKGIGCHIRHDSRSFPPRSLRFHTGRKETSRCYDGFSVARLRRVWGFEVLRKLKDIQTP